MTMTTVCPSSHNNELLKIIFQWGFSCYMYFLIYTSAEVTKNVNLQQKGFGHFFLATFSCFTGNAIALQIIIYTFLFPPRLLRGRHSKLLVSINNLCDIKSSIKYSLSYASKQNASQRSKRREVTYPYYADVSVFSNTKTSVTFYADNMRAISGSFKIRKL